MKVKLLSHTSDPEKLVAMAGRLCYSAKNIDEISEGFSEEKIQSQLEMLNDLGHFSPIEHINFTFAIEGVSRSVLAQITRHRIASFSVQSQRYVTFKQFEYVVPPEIEQCPQAKEIYLTAMHQDQTNYEKLIEILTEKHIKACKEQGYDEKRAKYIATKMAGEDARFVLPNACETKIIMTMNARSLHNFFSVRCCNRAQWEIRALAIEMYRLTYTVAPNLMKNAAPGCVKGRCTEGKMNCGKAEEVISAYSKIWSNT